MNNMTLHRFLVCQNPECYICYKKNNDNFILSCSHNIHIPCLLDWLKKNNTCPICRKPISIHDYVLFELQEKYE